MKLGSVTARPGPTKDATTQQIRSFTYEKQPIFACSNDATQAAAVASSKGAIFPRERRFCCIVASFSVGKERRLQGNVLLVTVLKVGSLRFLLFQSTCVHQHLGHDHGTRQPEYPKPVLRESCGLGRGANLDKPHQKQLSRCLR